MSADTPLHIPSLKERWLAAVPLFLSLLVAGYMASRIDTFTETFRALRIDLPLPTRMGVWIGQFISMNPLLLLPGMFLLCCLHFGWAAKSRGRLMWFNQLWMLLFTVTLLTMVVGMILPAMKISTALRKK